MWFQLLVSLVPQVSPALRALQALLVPQVRMLLDFLGPRAPPDHQDLLATLLLASPEPQVDLANPASPELLVTRETLALLAPRDPGECLDLLEAPDLLASLQLASLDLLVCLEQWDPGVSLV